MRNQTSFGVILAACVLSLARIAVAQTGEFAGQVPGPIVRHAWKIQDQLQSARSGTSVKSVNHTARNRSEPNSPTPQANGAKTRE
jgi:hypothetical protein